MTMHKKFSNSPLITISQNQKICQIVLIHSLMSGKLPWTCLKCQKQFRFQIIMNLSLSKEILQKFRKQTTRRDTVEIFINTNRSWNPGIVLVKMCPNCSGLEDRERIGKLLVLWCCFSEWWSFLCVLPLGNLLLHLGPGREIWWKLLALVSQVIQARQLEFLLNKSSQIWFNKLNTFPICSQKAGDVSHYEESWVVSGFWRLNFASLEDDDTDIKH